MNATRRHGYGWMFLLAAFPFYVNDFYNITGPNFLQWLTVDYALVKAVPVCVLGWLLFRRRLSWADLGLKRIPLAEFAIMTVIMTAVGWAVDAYGWPFFQELLPDLSLTSIPFDEASPWYVLDCYLGLALVALLEETIFRGLARTWLEKRFGPGSAVVFSALLFGLIHWSQGLHAIVNTAIIGALFSLGVQRNGCVWPQIIAHFIINYVSFCSCLWSGS